MNSCDDVPGVENMLHALVNDALDHIAECAANDLDEKSTEMAKEMVEAFRKHLIPIPEMAKQYLWNRLMVTVSQDIAARMVEANARAMKMAISVRGPQENGAEGELEIELTDDDMEDEQKWIEAPEEK